MPPPKVPLEPASVADWKRAEAAFGLRLPEDFKEFLSTYGVGQIDGFVWLWSPAATNRYIELVQGAKSTLDAFRIGDDPMVAGFKLHPLVPGILPYGGTDNGNTFAWLTKGPPRDWPTIVTSARGPEFVRRNANATTVLFEILSGHHRYKCVFPEDFPSAQLEFASFKP